MNRNKPRYWLEKRSRVRTGFPMATVIYYGPTADFASKVVVGIVPSNRDRSASKLIKWFDEDQDVRENPQILNEVLDCLDEHGVKRTVMYDRILGCPTRKGRTIPKARSAPSAHTGPTETASPAS